MSNRQGTLKTLSKSVRGNRAVSVATVFCSMAEVVFEIVIPICMSNLLDKGIQSGDMSAVWRYGAELLGLAALDMTTGILAARIGARASVGLAANLREDMYRNVQTFSF